MLDIPISVIRDDKGITEVKKERSMNQISPFLIQLYNTTDHLYYKLHVVL